MMRLAVWQQFSSNHSSSYTVVGEFQSAEAAQAAAETIRNIVNQAIEWCHNNLDYCRYQPMTNLTPVEEQVGLQYGFDWKERIDWLTYGLYENTVVSFGQLAIVDPEHVDTWQTGHQFADLLTAMGAKVARDVMEGQEPGYEEQVWLAMHIEVTCQANSAEAASAIADELNSAFQETNHVRANYRIPWLIFHPKLKTYSAEQILGLDAQYLEDLREADRLHKQFPNQQNQEFHERWGKVRVLPHDQWVFIGDCRRDLDISRIKVEQTGQRLIIRELRFSHLFMGFAAFVQYLEQGGCTDIQYTAHQS